MRRFIDLHTHSSVSDGSMAPADLIALADAANLAVVALTDHDTTGGLDEARQAADDTPDLHFVPGVEVSAAFPGGTMHILGLGIDDKSPALVNILKRLREARDERNPKIIRNLQALGVDVTIEDVAAVASQMHGRGASEVTSRLHIAEAIRRKGAVKTIGEAFTKYIADGAAAYEEKDRLTPREIVTAIHEASGAAVLAHPPQLNCTNDAQFERVLRDLIGVGLDAIEAYHSDNTPVQTRLYLDLARRFSLGVTGGSDFHGSAKQHVRLGKPRTPVSLLTGKLARLVTGSQ